MPILRVALDVPLNKLFDYRAPDKDVTAHDVGLRVRIPFGKRVVTGVIMEVGGHSSIHPEKLKSVSLIFRDVEPLPKFARSVPFCAAYYHHPLGQVK
jgi:primosomal protein N' (replication factor Y)